MTTDRQRSKLHVIAAALIACSLSVHLHAAEVPAQARAHAYLENLWRTKGTPAISTVQGYNACLVNYPAQDVVVAIMGNGYPVNPARNEAVALADIFLP